MKSKGTASLYEVLKSASKSAADPASAPAAPAGAAGTEAQATSLQERLAAYKARKLAEAGAGGPPAPVPAAPPAPVSVAEATPPPVPASPMPASPVPARKAVEPRPAPAPEPPRLAPAPAPAAPTLVIAPEAGEADPGEKVVRLTYNSAVFAGLVVVGLLFVAYAFGVQSGRRRAAAESAPAAVAPRAAAPVPALDLAPPVPPPPPREYTIRLAEWRFGTAKERLTAGAAADDLKKALDRAGFKGAEKMMIQRGAEPKLVLLIDRVRDVSADPARTRLAALRAFRTGGQTPFAQAAFEEISR
jgi:hypothetical protein